MIEAPFALAFTAGMVATVNPCGFAMLPAYLALFVSADENSVGGSRQFGRALPVVAAATAGFAIVFGALGMLFQAGFRAFIDVVPYAALGVGAALAVAGVAMMFGWRPRVMVPALEVRSTDRSVRSMTLFGMSYGVASLSCTLPVFLSVVVGTANRSSALAGVAALVAYVAGMASVLALATLSVAAARQSLTSGLRRASRHVPRISAMMLILTGTYLVYFWSWALITEGTSDSGYGPIDFVDRRSAVLTRFLSDHSSVVGLAAVAAVGLATLVVVTGRRRHPTQRPDDVAVGSATNCCDAPCEPAELAVRGGDEIH